MVAAFLITAIAGIVVWLVFFKFKWLRFTYGWAFFLLFFVAHLALVFLVGMRFVAPYSTDVKVIQHTIQLVPRLPEPTLVTAVYVKPNVPVKKGDPLFQFDKRPYQYKVNQLEAQLAKAKQNVLVLKADVDVAEQRVAITQDKLAFAKYQQKLASGLAQKGAGPEEESQKANAQLKIAQSAVKEAQADLVRARLEYESQIDGVNTTVAAFQAELAQAQYYLDNTTMVAPEDGFITNLQVVPGMVAGIIRAGGIATFIVDAGRYVLGTYYQEQLKYVKEGQPVELAIDLHPGQIFKGKVESVWWASGQGQMLPSGRLPSWHLPMELPQGRFAVKIKLDDEKAAMFPIGAQGAAAIYTGGGGFAVLRRISIRTYTWGRWLYPLPF
ncbi:HlyD family secretion protein [Desulfoferula mesophila]|uniref:Multidrug transporter n=1 Tax=Desulfoferula mesophila TaxID=3058419 RepID=A0AAU9EYA4_9BACT|nr:multidrug transporter [Desulfoferula mesophilus]